MAISEKGLEVIEEKNERVILFEGLLTVYEQGKLEETKIEALKERAFEDTGDRKFGEKYEKACKDYLNNLSTNFLFVSIIPAFDSVGAIDCDWVVTKFAQGAKIEKIDNKDTRKRSDIEAEAQKYLNPEISLPTDYEYYDNRAIPSFIRKTIGTYDKNSDCFIGKTSGFGASFMTTASDFIVTNFYKEGEFYHVYGIPLALKIQNEEEIINQMSESFKVDVHLDFATMEDESTTQGKKLGTKIGTGTYYPQKNKNDEIKIDYDFDVNTMDIPAYEHILKDNPQGEKSESEIIGARAQGPFYLLSKKEVGKDLEKTKE